MSGINQPYTETLNPRLESTVTWYFGRWWIPSNMLNAIELLSSFVDLVQPLNFRLSTCFMKSPTFLKQGCLQTEGTVGLALSSTCIVRYLRGGKSSLSLMAWLLIGKLRLGTAPVRRVFLVSSEKKLTKLPKKAYISVQNLKSTVV